MRRHGQIANNHITCKAMAATVTNFYTVLETTRMSGHNTIMAAMSASHTITIAPGHGQELHHPDHHSTVIYMHCKDLLTHIVQK